MATGTVTLFWYVACCGFSLFVAAVAAGLVVYGQRSDRRRREERRLAAEAQGPREDEPPASRVDPDPPAR